MSGHTISYDMYCPCCDLTITGTNNMAIQSIKVRRGWGCGRKTIIF